MSEIGTTSQNDPIQQRQLLLDAIEKELPGNENRLPVKKQIIQQITEIFDGIFKQVDLLVKYKYNSKSVADQIIATFVTSLLVSLEQEKQKVLQEASRKSKPEVVLQALFGAITDESGEPVSFATAKEKPVAIHKKKEFQEGEVKDKEGLPLGPTMGVVRNFLLNHNFILPTTETTIKGEIETGKIRYGNGVLKNYEPYEIARQLFDMCNTGDLATILTQPLSIVSNGVKYTFTFQLLLKSFYANDKVKTTVGVKKVKEFTRSNYTGQEVLETFFKLIHIPELKDQPSTLHLTAVVAALNKVKEEGRAVTPKIGPHILTFGETTIDMSKFLEGEDGPNTLQARQIFNQLMTWFEYELYSFAQLTKKIKVPVKNGSFSDNKQLIQSYIDSNVVINSTVKSICDEAYSVLQQFHNFVAYYADVIGNSHLLNWFKTTICDIDQQPKDDLSYKSFLKQIMPHLAYNATSTHVYCLFVTFLNRAKGESISGLIGMVGKLDDYIHTHTPTTPKNLPGIKRVTNDESDLITDWSDRKIEEYVAELDPCKKVQEIYLFFRNSTKQTELGDKKREREQYISACCTLFEKFLSEDIITSNEKVNAVKVYLQSFLKHGNKVTERAKQGKQPLNIAREIRKILTK